MSIVSIKLDEIILTVSLYIKKYIFLLFITWLVFLTKQKVPHALLVLRLL